MPDPSHHMDLAETFADIARSLMNEPTLDATLDKIIRTAVATIPGCQHAALSVIERRTITTRAASDPIPERVDAIQYEVNQGPCLDAIKDHEVFGVGDLTTDSRWPASRGGPPRRPASGACSPSGSSPTRRRCAR